jgi:uncharacterized repeat protein (TIGR03803 family)
MSFSSYSNWVRKLISRTRGSAKPSRARRPGRLRLRLEQLEDRWVPSLTTLATFDPFPNGISPTDGVVEDSHANFFGVAEAGGGSGVGTVFEVAAGSGTVTSLAVFNGANGANPSAGLALDSGGNLFGTAYKGGASGKGTVFEVVAGSGTITTLATFNGTNGANPDGRLLEDSHGDLFGTTYAGGASNDGTVFEVAAGSGAVTTLASFNGTNGQEPRAGLAEDGSGNLFGTTYLGGASNDGTVFEVASGSGTITTLATFHSTNGAYPIGSLIEDGAGNLFGIATEGGAAGAGTVFKVAAGSGAITTIATFNGTNGSEPSGLVEDSSGDFFGTAEAGGASFDGTVFEVASGSGGITTLATFNGANGTGPSGLIRDGSGNIFGTSVGGVMNAVFEVAAGSSTITNLAAFNSPGGGRPVAGVIEDGSGNLFGTASNGCTTGDGGLFELSAGSGAITTLAASNGPAGDLVTGLVEDSSGNLFGTTLGGGASGYGSVFKVAAGSHTITTLASFNYINGSAPTGSLIEDASGDLFGTTSSGGANGDGTVFEVTSGSGAITVIASFNGTNGSDPTGVFMDSSGNLFGATDSGGSSQFGTVFEVHAGSGTITPLASFSGPNGQYPSGSLATDSSGDLFGTAQLGGASGDGTVFELAAGSGSITTLASFNGTNGSTPTSGLIRDSGGNLYGTTNADGADGDGTVFELAAGSGTIATLATFNGSNGANPSNGALIADASGNLFGTTILGGATGYGTVFEVQRAATSVEASNQSATISTASQSITLSATVTPSSGTVNEGTVIFSVFNGSTQIGTSVTSGTVAGGAASATYTLPGGTPAGAYSIHVSYSGGPDYSSSNNSADSSFPTLTVQQTGAIIDNGQAGYSETGTGWTSFSDPSAYNGNERYAAPGTGANTATWQAPYLAPGAYEVQVDWTPYANRATNATYNVYDGSTLLGSVTVNQQFTPIGGATLSGVPFQNIGRFVVSSGTLSVVLSDNANGYVIADAMDIQPAPLPVVVDNGQFGFSTSGTGWSAFNDPSAYNGNEQYAAPGTGANTATWHVSSLAAGVYNIEVNWTAYSNRATNATYQVYDGSTLLGSVTVNQQRAPVGGVTAGGVTFQSLGLFIIDSGTFSVVLSDNANGYVIADAMDVQAAALPAVVDNNQYGYSTTGTGWANFADSNAYLGTEQYAAPGTGANAATWQVSHLPAGIYDLQVDWTAYSNRATNATYRVYDGSTLIGTVQVNQQLAPLGGATVGGVTFQSLGRFSIASGTVSVVLSDDANGYVIADAAYVQMATLPVVVDNNQYGFTTAGPGWASFSDNNAYDSSEEYVAPGTGANSATWTASGLPAGAYDVEMNWTAYSNRATNATYQVYDGSTQIATVQLNQQLAPTAGATVNGVAFQNLGRFIINSGAVTVTVSDNANGYVIADAMVVQTATFPVVVDNGQYGYSTTGTGWANFNDPNACNGNEQYAAPGTGANTATWQVTDLAARSYNVEVDWTAYSNRATNATYEVFDGSTLLGTVSENQQVAPTGGATVGGVTFQSLGQFTVSSGTLRVVLSDNANGYVIADAIVVD